MPVDSKLGDAYFDTRARLGTAIYSLARLGSELEIHPAQISLLQNQLANLKDPFLFVVVGEVNAGKSTLLNALFGEDFCKADVVPMTSKICLFKYGPENRDIPITETLTEMYRPSAFLQDFNIVDTPGTNSIMEHHQEITERFIPMADLVIFTFGVTNPWGASAWQLLEKIHKRWFKNIIFVLQQCDLRDREEIAAIIEHLRLTAVQKLGAQFPIFAVSGKQAFLAKTSALDKERLWNRSGFEGLESYISQSVNSSEVREQKLGNVSRSARVVLHEAKEQLATASRILAADEELLSGLGEDVKNQRKRTLEKFGGFFRSLDSQYVEASMGAASQLESRLKFKHLYKNQDLPQLLEQSMIERMVAGAPEQVDQAVTIVEDDLQHLWRQLAAKMQQHFNFRLRVGTASGEPDWSEQRGHMRDRLVATLQEELPKLRLEKLMSPKLAGRKGVTTFFIVVAVLAAAGGLTAGLLGVIPATKMLMFGAAILAVVLASIIGAGLHSQKTHKELAAELGTQLEKHRNIVGTAVRNAILEEANGFFDDFLRLFEPLQQLCEEHRSRYQPQVKQLAELERAFNDVDMLVGVEPNKAPGQPLRRREA